MYHQIKRHVKKPEEGSGQEPKGEGGKEEEKQLVFQVPPSFDMSEDRPTIYKHGILQWMMQTLAHGCPALEL